MTEETSGLSATEIRDAHRLHEALVIKLAPPAEREAQGYLGAALYAQMITRHAPTSSVRMAPCPEHKYHPVMVSVPGFECGECVLSLALDCRACKETWPCADVVVAQNACELDAPGAVDEFLDNMAMTS